MESQVTTLMHEYMDRLNFEMHRKRIVSFGFRSTFLTDAEPIENVIWWIRAKYLLEDKIVDDLVIYAATNGLSLTSLSDPGNEEFVAYQVRYTGAPFVMPSAEEIASAFVEATEIAPRLTEAKFEVVRQKNPGQRADAANQAAQPLTETATNPDVDQAEHRHEVVTDESPARGKPKKSKCSPAAWQAYRKRVLAGEDETSEVMSLELVAVKVDMSERTILRMLEDPSSKLKRFGGTPAVAGSSAKRKPPGSGRVLITRKSYNECFGQTGK